MHFLDCSRLLHRYRRNTPPYEGGERLDFQAMPIRREMALFSPQDRETVLAEMQECGHQAVQSLLDGKEFDDSLVEGWCAQIVSHILQDLKPKRTPQFKFISSCMILLRRSQNVNETQMSLWDTQKDLRITTKWSNETMQCIVSIWAFKTRFP